MRREKRTINNVFRDYQIIPPLLSSAPESDRKWDSSDLFACYLSIFRTAVFDVLGIPLFPSVPVEERKRTFCSLRSEDVRRGRREEIIFLCFLEKRIVSLIRPERNKRSRETFSPSEGLILFLPFLLLLPSSREHIFVLSDEQSDSEKSAIICLTENDFP